MLKKFSLAGVALAISATALVPVAPALAEHNRYERQYRNDYRGDYRNDYRSNYRDGYQQRGYRQYSDDRDYRYSNNYRARQKCQDGDGGTIVGAIAGGLLGNVIAGRGSRTLGSVIGAGAGALAGRAIDRSDRPNYCR